MLWTSPRWYILPVILKFSAEKPLLIFLKLNTYFQNNFFKSDRPALLSKSILFTYAVAFIWCSCHGTTISVCVAGLVKTRVSPYFARCSLKQSTTTTRESSIRAHTRPIILAGIRFTRINLPLTVAASEPCRTTALYEAKLILTAISFVQART